MRRRLIDPNTISHEGSISEDELRARMLRDAYEDAGWIGPDDKPIKGCTGAVHRGEGRKGGYHLRISRDLRLSDQTLIPGPASK